MYTLEDEPLSLLVRLELGDLCNGEKQEQDGIQVAGLPHNCSVIFCCRCCMMGYVLVRSAGCSVPVLCGFCLHAVIMLSLYISNNSLFTIFSICDKSPSLQLIASRSTGI